MAKKDKNKTEFYKLIELKTPKNYWEYLQLIRECYQDLIEKGTLECVWYVLGLPMKYNSRVVFFINACHPDFRMRVLKM